MSATSSSPVAVRVRISSQMQVRIPADLFRSYGFDREAYCVATEHGVEFRPVKGVANESVQILQQLMDQGLTGRELVAAFQERVSSQADPRAPITLEELDALTQVGCGVEE